MKLNVNVSNNKSIDAAIEKLKKMNFGGGFDDNVVNNLVDKCYERCIQNLENMQHQLYPSTQFRGIKEAISKEYAKDGVGYVKIKAPAIFVELGTGIKGKTGRHPEAENFKWVYGDKGWTYPTDSAASNPNKIQLENGDWVAGTQGQPARPFAYNAALYIRSIVKDEVKISYKNIVG